MNLHGTGKKYKKGRTKRAVFLYFYPLKSVRYSASGSPPMVPDTTTLKRYYIQKLEMTARHLVPSVVFDNQMIFRNQSRCMINNNNTMCDGHHIVVVIPLDLDLRVVVVYGVPYSSWHAHIKCDVSLE